MWNWDSYLLVHSFFHHHHQSTAPRFRLKLNYSYLTTFLSLTKPSRFHDECLFGYCFYQCVRDFIIIMASLWSIGEICNQGQILIHEWWCVVVSCYVVLHHRRRCCVLLLFFCWGRWKKTHACPRRKTLFWFFQYFVVGGAPRQYGARRGETRCCGWWLVVLASKQATYLPTDLPFVPT